MELFFDRVFQFSDNSQVAESLQMAANLLKDYIVPNSSLAMGRSSGQWFWQLSLPIQATLPSQVSVLLRNQQMIKPVVRVATNGWALHGRTRRNSNNSEEQFGRPLHSLLDFPLESLFALVPMPIDFTIRLTLSANPEPVTGMRDAAMNMHFWSDNESVIQRMAQWIHARPLPYNPRNPGAYFCEIGLSELPFIVRVPVYSDTFLPHLKAITTNVLDYVRANPDGLTRGLLLAGLPGSGKSTTLQKILSCVIHYPKLESVLIADIKGEYQAWSASNGVNYLAIGRNPSCLSEMKINLFIPPANLRLSTYIDALAILLSIGNFGGSGLLLPGYIKLFLEEYYCALLLHRIAIDDWPMDTVSQRLLLLNLTGRQLQGRLQGNLNAFTYANRDLVSFWEDNSDSVLTRIFGRNGGHSNSRHEIADVIASRIGGGFVTCILQFFDYSESGRSIDCLLTERWCLGLNGFSKTNVQLLMATFTLLGLECLLAGPEKPSLSHLYVYEEAHLVAAQSVSSDEILTIDALVGQTVDRALAESRSKGCSIILIDQLPGTKLLSSVLANTNIKICHNLLGKDAELMARVMGLSPETNFSLLGVGECYVKLGDDQPPMRSRIRLNN